MKITVELEVDTDTSHSLNDTELRAELHQDIERALSLAPMSTTVYGAEVLEVHIESN